MQLKVDLFSGFDHNNSLACCNRKILGSEDICEVIVGRQLKEQTQVELLGLAPQFHCRKLSCLSRAHSLHVGGSAPPLPMVTLAAQASDAGLAGKLTRNPAFPSS